MIGFDSEKHKKHYQIFQRSQEEDGKINFAFDRECSNSEGVAAMAGAK